MLTKVTNILDPNQLLLPGFPVHFFKWGGNNPPPMGGDKWGGTTYKWGGNSARTFRDNWWYLKVIKSTLLSVKLIALMFYNDKNHNYLDLVIFLHQVERKTK